jgi:hypothetical protein
VLGVFLSVGQPLAAVSRTVHTLKEGEYTSARQDQTERLAQRQV